MFYKGHNFQLLLLVILYIGIALCQQRNQLTEKQRSRIKPDNDVDPKYLSVFDNKTKYLFKIIHGRPENKKLEPSSCENQELVMPDFRAPGRRISEVKCLEHLWKIRFYDEALIKMVSCGKTYDTILLNANFGGYDAVASEFPHMGAIGWRTFNDTWLFMCEGALISEKYMLIAAHCSQNPRNDTRISDPMPKIVRFGEPDISDKEEIGKAPTDVLIRRIIKHPFYSPPLKYYDIAIVELETEITFSTKVHPSCIWTNFFDIGTGKAELTGWNVIETNKTVSKKEFLSNEFDVFTRLTLAQKISSEERHKDNSLSNPVMQVAEVELINAMNCEHLLKEKRNRNWRGLLFHQFCAGRANINNTCQTDIGGVLQVPVDIPEYTDWTIHYIVGVRSFGFECDIQNTITIYTKVTAFIDWIEHIVWGDESYVK